MSFFKNFIGLLSDLVGVGKSVTEFLDRKDRAIQREVNVTTAELNKRLLVEKEEKQKVKIKVEQIYKYGHCYLKVTNRGETSAFAFSVELLDDLDSLYLKDDKFSTEELEVEDPVMIQLYLYGNLPDKIHLLFTWKDENGISQEKKKELCLY